MADCVNALKQWTGRAKATKIYDSTVDEFTDECLFLAVKGKPNVRLWRSRRAATCSVDVSELL